MSTATGSAEGLVLLRLAWFATATATKALQTIAGALAAGTLAPVKVVTLMTGTRFGGGPTRIAIQDLADGG